MFDEYQKFVIHFTPNNSRRSRPIYKLGIKYTETTFLNKAKIMYRQNYEISHLIPYNKEINLIDQPYTKMYVFYEQTPSKYSEGYSSPDSDGTQKYIYINDSETKIPSLFKLIIDACIQIREWDNLTFLKVMD